MKTTELKPGESVEVGSGRLSFVRLVGNEGDAILNLQDSGGVRSFHGKSGQPFVCAGCNILFVRGARSGRILVGVGVEGERIEDMIRESRNSPVTRKWDASKRRLRLVMVAAVVLAYLFPTAAYGQRIVEMPSSPPRLSSASKDLLVISGVLPVREPAENIPESVLAQVRVHCVQVGVNNGDGSQGWGSGIYLGDRLVLTAAHVVGGARKARVNFPNPTNDQGKFLDSVVGVVAKTDRTWDQAVIELEAFPKHNPVGSPLANANPKRGDKITFGGYPGGRKLRVVRGQFVSYTAAVGQSTADWFDADAGVISGYSGGAAYNDKGELFGNLWGSDGRNTVAVCLGRTKRFLLPWNARLEAWRLAIGSGNAGTMQWGNCPGGVCPPSYGGGGGSPRYIEPDDGDAPTPPPSNGGSLTPIPSQPSGPTISDLQAKLESLHASLSASIAKIESCECEDEPEQPATPPAQPPVIVEGGCDCPPGKGCDCEDDPSPAVNRQVIVIGDPKAEYFGRLKTDVEKTATYFDSVTLHPPPKDGRNVGTLPAIAYYVNGSHVRTLRGVIPVQSELYKIRNGEYQ